MSRYIIYARKSTESEDRQVLSIDSQIRELKDFARSRGLRVAAVLSEARSAKAPGRHVFGELMRELARGHAQGIICWKLDRLARNPIDGGALIWAVDEGKLHEIATPQRSFSNTGNDKFWMQLEFGMAKKYVDDLSDNVKRGLRAKLQLGWLPGLAPLGYRNDPVSREIVDDPERFPLVRKIFDAILAGIPPPKVLDLAADTWGLRTRQFKHHGGGPLGRSAFYRLLSDPFYYGLIDRKDGAFPGKHRPMITKDEFDRIQEILGRPNRPHVKKHAFAFTSLIRCDECGASVTAENKTNRYGTNYTYYHCTKRIPGTSCGQKVIRREALEQQIVSILDRLTIADDYRAWAIEHLRTVHDRETTARAAADRALDAAYRACQQKLDSLIDLKLQGRVTDEDYDAKRATLLGEQIRLKTSLDDADVRAMKWRDLAERAFVFANEAKQRFETGSLEEKREILLALGSNLTLRDKTLRIQLEKPFQFFDENNKALRAESSPFEPQEGCMATNENSGSVAAAPVWCGVADRVRTFFVTAPDRYRWPKFCMKEE